MTDQAAKKGFELFKMPGSQTKLSKPSDVSRLAERIIQTKGLSLPASKGIPTKIATQTNNTKKSR